MCVCGVQDTSRTDPRFVVGLIHRENREERGEVPLVSLAWRGATGIISAAGPWLLPAPLLGGGTACWWERSVVPKACSPVAPSNPFSICPFIYYLPLSLALFFVSWFLMLVAGEGAVLRGRRGQQQTPLYCCPASPPSPGDRSVWQAQLITFLNAFPR